MAFPSSLTDLLENNQCVVRSLVKFALGTGTYGFWNGSGVLTYNSLDYLQNALISISEPLYTTGTSAADFTIELAESRDFGISPDVMAAIEDEDYKGYPVTVYDAYFDPDTRELLHVEPMIYGYIDTVDHVVDSEGFKLVGNLVTGAIDNHREGYRTASHEDQQLVRAGDLFFEHAAKAKNEYFDIEL